MVVAILLPEVGLERSWLNAQAYRNGRSRWTHQEWNMNATSSYDGAVKLRAICTANPLRGKHGVRKHSGRHQTPAASYSGGLTGRWLHTAQSVSR
ncbi:hypothetical protein BAUCODRAFT_39753 [Baudoinia panamericana UAMH 10762]|uniref:Uncharacterized protein n=1 Tax=Baudoinia panamericana (strain UAMH 10762) TaxID=717646 RepID=M2MWJ1_BAUPA|nr:uncharacterized protein BAUCODRAFT_39753 [Baudoinia panamericana UAMH 10762]EMC90954.1 hypothetical protein BAUCODRAFT_39753 [Baudoinia panamericana UAMH 10762]